MKSIKLLYTTGPTLFTNFSFKGFVSLVHVVKAYLYSTIINFLFLFPLSSHYLRTELLKHYGTSKLRMFFSIVTIFVEDDILLVV